MSGGKPKKKRRWRYQIDLGPLSITLWGIFILFFLAWIFVLGIFVGRGITPGKITDMSELKGEITKIQEAIVPEDTGKADDPASDKLEKTEPELVFYEKLTSKKDEAKNSLYTEAGTEINKTVSKPIKPVDVQTSVSEIKDIKPPADSTPGSGSGQYTIQVASIEELANAKKTVNQLVEKGFNAYYYETTVKGKKYFRVRCGKFSDRAEAKEYSLRLEEKTGLKGYVTDTE
jgi:cell division septation protein DedD